MKKVKWLKGLTIVSLAFTTALLVCCGDKKNSSTSNNPSSETGEITLSKDSLGLDVFEQYDLDIEGADTVVWTSENGDIATVNEDGIITGVSEGTTNIVATVGTKTFKCEVTVRASEDVPTIVLNESAVELLIEDNYTLNPKVSYKKNKYDAEFSYESRNEQVVTVDQNGKITAVAIGSTEIEISANWGTYVNSIYLKTMLNVVVKENVTLYINSEPVSLESGESAQLTAVAKVNGEVATGELVWSSSDADIIAVDATGKITTGTKFGTAGITVSYTTDRATYTSNPVYVTLKKPTFDLTAETHYDYDLSKQAPLSFTNIEGIDGTAVTAFLDEEENALDIEDNAIPYTTASKISVGDHTLRVETENGEYHVPITVADYVICDTASMDAWYAKVKETTKTSGDLYVVVSKNFTYEGNGFVVWPELKGGGVQKGTFDGRGHVIKGIKTSYTMFSTIQGTIKNIAFVDGKYNANGRKFGALARWIDRGRLENVYMSGSVVGDVQDVISGGVSSDYNDPTFVNCIFNIAFAGENSVFYNDELAGREAEQSTFTNVYAISKTKTSINKGGDSTGIYPTVNADFLTAVSTNIQNSPFNVKDNALYFGETMLVAFVEGKELAPTYYALSAKTAFSISGINGVQGEIKQVTIAGADVTADVANGAISYEKMSSYGFRGTQTFGVQTATKIYSGELTIADYVIFDSDDLRDWYTNAVKKGVSAYTVVANDFTFEGTALAGVRNPSWEPTTMFTGTFDGRGHVIKGLQVTAGSMLGKVEVATMKNIAFVDMVQGDESNGTGIFARTIAVTTLENVYMSVKSTTNSSAATCSFANVYNQKVVMKNVILDLSEAAVDDAVFGKENVAFGATRNWQPSNLYVITAKTTKMLETGDTAGLYASANEAFFTAVATNMQDSLFSVKNNELYFGDTKVL